MRVAYIFERYPVPTQTFLRREIAGLREHGIEVEIHSLFEFRWSELLNVPCELFRQPSLLLDAWRLLWRYRPTNAENFFSTLWAAIFALARARRMRRRPPDIMHGVWATGPATAAAILARLCGVPFSFGAQAYDIYRHGGDAFLDPKLRAAAFIHTATQRNSDYLRGRCRDARIVLARRGLARLPEPVARDGASGRIRILSVGRLVSKKGHEHQLAACAELKRRGVPFQLRIVGDGPERRRLRVAIERDALQEAVELRGAVEPERVDDEYRWADIFWHTGVVDARGDRDGLPNVIPEAFAHKLAVISSDTSGAAEAVIHGRTGLVADVTDPAALADAVQRLAADAELRRALGENGRRWVAENFLADHNAGALAEAFREAVR